MNFSFTPDFKKDLKALSKKIHTLPLDVERVKPRVAALYTQIDSVDLDEFRKLFFASKKASIINSVGEVEVIKMRLDTDTATYRNKLRLIFVAVKSDNDITFVELYSKSDKDREDQSRIRSYLGK